MGDLDFDVADGDSHDVTVTATDSMGAADTITVTINVTNVNEKPTLTEIPTTVQEVGRIETEENETALDGDASTSDNVEAANFAGTDPEGGAVELSTSGADGDMFKLTATDAADGYTETLAFKANPDFEMPGDANNDNIYEVTVVATDGDGNTAEAESDRQGHQRGGSREGDPAGASAAGRRCDDRHPCRFGHLLPGHRHLAVVQEWNGCDKR